MDNLAPYPDFVSSECTSDDSSLDNDNTKRVFMDFSAIPRMADKSKKLAKESFQAMIENEKLGDVVIIEACYMLVGTKKNVHSLLFRSLQQLIDHEREVSFIFCHVYLRITESVFCVFRKEKTINARREVTF